MEMPSGVELNGIENFEEVSHCYSMIDDNYAEIIDSLQKTKEQLDSITKPLVITEGKTDWKHIENALNAAKENGKNF